MATRPKKKQSGAKKAVPKAKSRTTAKGAAAKKTRARAGARTKPRTRAKAARAVAAERRHSNALRLRAFSPGLTVDDLARSLRFYVEGLGFTVKGRWEQDGQVMGAMLVAGRCELGLAQDDWAKGRDRVKGVGLRIWAETVQDLETLAGRISAQGFAVDGPKTESWGARTLTVTDPDGFKISFHAGMGS